MKIITVLEAEVPEDKWVELEHEYGKIAAGNHFEIRPMESFLMQRTDNPSRWQIISVWKNRETLQKMRNSLETPPGVQVFKAVGAEPTLSVYQIHFTI